MAEQDLEENNKNIRPLLKVSKLWDDFGHCLVYFAT